MIDVIDPSTEEVIGQVSEAGADGVDAAVRAAQAALPSWSATPLDERLALLEALATRLEHQGEALTLTLAREMGMPLAQARAVQAVLPVAVLRATAQAARDYPFEQREGPALIRREPAGVVGAITPWNFPLHQIAAKLAPALAAGCTVVLKPSELAPLNARHLADAARDAGLPDGVLTIVNGSGPITGEALVRHPGVAVISLTGSVAAGRAVGAIAGEQLKRACLELGGKSPSVVLDDADAEAAIRASADRCFLNAGQACNAPTRLLVPRELLADAEALCAEVAGGLVVGPALDPESTMGPVISAASRDRLRGEIDGADARLVYRGEVAQQRGYFVAPAVFSEVDAQARLAQQELFGPILAIQPYADDDDAIRIANATPYGLSAEVWSGDTARAASVASQIRAGQIKVNGVRTRDTLTAPFGGYGQSGLGRELGPHGIDEFVEIKAVLGV